MLKVGDKITVGDKLARDYSYGGCVEKEGEIISGPHTSSGITYYSVKIKGTHGRWGIIVEDCIPFKPKNNREAISHLESEY